jgi:hypothetical protein
VQKRIYNLLVVVRYKTEEKKKRQEELAQSYTEVVVAEPGASYLLVCERFELCLSSCSSMGKIRKPSSSLDIE